MNTGFSALIVIIAIVASMISNISKASKSQQAQRAREAQKARQTQQAARMQTQRKAPVRPQSQPQVKPQVHAPHPKPVQPAQPIQPVQPLQNAEPSVRVTPHTDDIFEGSMMAHTGEGYDPCHDEELAAAVNPCELAPDNADPVPAAQPAISLDWNGNTLVKAMVMQEVLKRPCERTRY